MEVLTKDCGQHFILGRKLIGKEVVEIGDSGCNHLVLCL